MVVQVAVLVGLGIAAVLLHKALRAPLHLPGRQGLIWMALLAGGRAASPLPWAGTLTGLGAGLCAFGGFFDPLSGFIYSLSGVLADWVYTAWPLLRRHAWAFALACGLLHALKPLLRWGINAWYLPLQHGSLAGGLAYPLATHFLFGALGALGGLYLLRTLRRL
ncbi:MAG: hypothetical protein IT369_08640 [Candidatus Latescibacteria bacterium]|nr:hypothetical protein [Candidatus Latescibacterota bacterium]